MTWVKLDDGFPDHPKVVSAGPSAAWLHLCGLCYCARYLTDGYIPAAQIRRLADVQDGEAEILARRLVSVGLWMPTPDGYRATTQGIAALPQSRRARSAVRRAWEAIAHWMRPLVFTRDGRVCRRCGETELALHIDHVIPIALGGDNDPDNLQVLCRPCNLRKGARL